MSDLHFVTFVAYSV